MAAPERGPGGTGRSLAFGVMAVLLAMPAAGVEPEASSILEAEAFHYRSTLVGDESADLSGIELRWLRSGPRWSLSVAVPGLSASSPSGLVLLGPTFAGYRLRQGTTGAPFGAGATDGAGPAPAGSVAGVRDAAIPSDFRQSGLGDVRLQGARWIGHDSPVGRFSLRAGVKLPTADEDHGLGTGRSDLWAGVGWRRQGWATDFEAYLEWVKLGDPPGLVLKDGAAAGVLVDWPRGRGGLKAGLEVVDAGIDGDPARVRAIGEAYGTMGKRSGWGMEISAGLTDSAPDFGLAVALRF